jgi:hypothetical protein
LVARTSAVKDLRDVKPALLDGSCNVIALSMADLGFDETCDFVFAVRRKHPGVVFVLCIVGPLSDLGDDLFTGERRRLLHYYTVDVLIPESDLHEVVGETLRRCLVDLGLSSPGA